ncbi:FAD-binding oxidoreductase [Candidatus Microgenomates bacterium]|nr:MAG: FAD-binding oxidoreductase [Candidatus Microgenomates bacterium]
MIDANLQNTFRGKVVLPSDPEYDQLRTPFYGGIDKKPAVIIKVTNAADIKSAIALAKTEKRELAIRSGGHSIPGFCVSDDAVVIDLRDMNNIEINPDEKTAWAEAGCTAGEVTNVLDPHDLVLGFGDTGSVGIGGITLGGGVGYLVRKFGLTIDNLLAAEVVTADGQQLTVSDKEYPDLFWALRGGGGNFGVVTRFKYRLHEFTQAVGGMLLLPAQPKVIVDLMQLTSAAPDELSTIVNIMPAPPMPMVPKEHHGKLIVMVLMMYLGNAETGNKVVAPFRRVVTPIADMIRPMRYKDIFFPEQEGYHPTAVSRTMFMKNVGEAETQTIVDQLQNLDAPMRVVQLRRLGGAMTRVPVAATAFAHRRSNIMTNIASFYETEEQKDRRQEWADDIAKKLYQGDDGVYVNFMGTTEMGMLRQAYPGDTWKRLVEVKRTYDPENLFRLNVNILET